MIMILVCWTTTVIAQQRRLWHRQMAALARLSTHWQFKLANCSSSCRCRSRARSAPSMARYDVQYAAQADSRAESDAKP
jgi:hypothetical protein